MELEDGKTTEVIQFKSVKIKPHIIRALVRSISMVEFRLRLISRLLVKLSI